MSKKKNKKEEVKLMETSELVKNMDVLYRVERKTEEERNQAIENMQKLISLIQEANLEQVYFSPTELIINAVLCYSDFNEKIYSEVDKKICDLVCKLGYMKKDKVQI